MTLECQSDSFQLPVDLHYLNCAYMAPQSRTVEAAGLEALHLKRNPADITPDDFFSHSNRLRELFARLINVPDPRRIAILPSVSYGMSIASRNLLPEGGPSGGNIVVAEGQFPSGVLTWRRLATLRDAQIRMVARPSGRLAGVASSELAIDAIDADTRVVCLPNVHWTDGTCIDLVKIGDKARQVGAALVVDGTQSIGALPFDATRVGADMVVCAGYKWLLGPYSISLAYFGPRFDDGEPLEETWIGRAGSDNFAGLTEYSDSYMPAAGRYDVGERSNFLLVPMMIAALEQVLAWTPSAIQSYCAKLREEPFRRLSAMGYELPNSGQACGHLWGIRPPPGLDVKRIMAELERERVSVSVRSGTIRVSPHLYNQPGDLDALVRALTSAVA